MDFSIRCKSAGFNILQPGKQFRSIGSAADNLSPADNSAFRRLPAVGNLLYAEKVYGTSRGNPPVFDNLAASDINPGIFAFPFHILCARLMMLETASPPDLI